MSRKKPLWEKIAKSVITGWFNPPRTIKQQIARDRARRRRHKKWI